eukprot:7209723-Pyramimonas_sp.AAC.1
MRRDHSSCPSSPASRSGRGPPPHCFAMGLRRLPWMRTASPNGAMGRGPPSAFGMKASCAMK